MYIGLNGVFIGWWLKLAQEYNLNEELRRVLMIIMEKKIGPLGLKLKSWD